MTSANSGGTWAADATVGGRDLGFNVWIEPGLPGVGTFTSSLKDANPAAGADADVDDAHLHGDDARRHGREVPGRRRATASYGPFNFVGPGRHGGHLLHPSGASLSQFNGFRYLKYKATLTTNNSAVTPSISSVQVCFADTAATSADHAHRRPGHGHVRRHDDARRRPRPPVDRRAERDGRVHAERQPAGSATTNASGVATLAQRQPRGHQRRLVPDRRRRLVRG